MIFLLFFHRLGERPLSSSHEARAAQEAQRMLDDHCFGLPRLYDDQPDLQKPPLYYWLVAGIAALRGGRVDAWAVRLPSTFAAIGCLAAVAGALRRRPVAAVVAAGALATMLHFTWLARVGRIDLPLAFAVTMALLSFRAGGWRNIVGYLTVAAGVMLKGPIGVVLPAAVCVAWGFASPLSRKRLVQDQPADAGRSPRHLGWGIPLVLILVLPWFVWASVATDGAFAREFLLKHNVNRFLGGDAAETPHAQEAYPWWFYGPILARDALPWTPLALGAGVWLLRRGRWRTEPEARFGLIWLVVVVLVFSCARFKRADYLAPAYPGLAILVGCVVDRWWQSATSRQCRGAAYGFALIMAGCVAGWLAFTDLVLPAQETAHHVREFAAMVRQHAPAPQVVLFFRAEAHELAFHLGRPLNTFREWENLNVWAGRPGPHYIIMPPDAAAEWPRHVTAGRLEEIARLRAPVGDAHRNLVLMRTCSTVGGLTPPARQQPP